MRAALSCIARVGGRQTFCSAAETPGGMNFVDAQMGRRMASRTVQEFNENIQVKWSEVK